MICCAMESPTAISVAIPPQEKIERLLTSDRTAGEVTVPSGYDATFDQTIQSVTITLTPPDMSDQRDDWSRFQTTLRQQAGIEDIQTSLGLMRRPSDILRQRMVSQPSWTRRPGIDPDLRRA
jgi:hypothetical protein